MIDRFELMFDSIFSNSDINNPYIVEMKKDLAGYQNFSAPGVDVHCLYGHNIGDTVDRLVQAEICIFYFLNK